jgi:fatty acid CoA ligase FadD9
MGEPVVRWTPAEAWLMAELARRAIVATLDGGPPVRAPALDLELQASDAEIALELRLPAEHATIALAPERPAGHPWRDGWMLVLVRGAERWPLAAGGPPIELRDARAAPVRVELAVPRRAMLGVLGGGGAAAEEGEPEAAAQEPVPLVDAAFHRYTRQSTVATGEAAAAGAAAGRLGLLAPWMAPTEAEPAPWWELDLGRAMCIARIRIDLAPVPPGTRIVCRAFGFGRPSGELWPDSVVLEATAEADTPPRLVLEATVVARYVRVELVAAAVARSAAGTGAAAGPRVALVVEASEVLAAELYADTLLGTMRRAFALFGERPLCLARDGDEGPYRPHLTYDAVWSLAAALARGLARRAEVPGARLVLGVMLRNRPEWIAAELAALIRGHVVVAMAPDDADDRLAEVLARAAPGCVICEAADAARLVRLAASARLIVACDDGGEGGEGGAGVAGEGGGARLVGWGALVAEGARETAPPVAPRSEDDPYAVLFTSGSTGAPKGAVRTYRTFHAMIQSYAIAHSPRHLSFQPLSHLSERMYLPTLLVHGGCVAFSRGGARLLDELRALEPTTVGSVPRLFEVLYASHQRRVRAASGEAGEVAGEAARQAIVEASLAEARRAFGGRLRAVSVGSAPVGPAVLAFMRRCFADIWVSEGYGSTEVGSIAFDGVVLPHVEVKLVPRADAPPPEPGAPERGEIHVRTPHTIAGYLSDPEATAAAIDTDGFFATGDLGERGADGRVRVIGRVRNTIKLAQGEFVSLERVEVALGGAAIADRVFVHAAHGAPGLAALVVPQADALARLVAARAPEVAASGDGAAALAELIARPGAAELVLGELRAHGLAAGLAPYELPRAVLLEAAPFTVEAGLLTPSGKLARGTLAGRHGARLAALAAGAAEVPVLSSGARIAEAGAPDAVDQIVRQIDRVVRVASGVAGRAIDPHEPLGTGVGVDSLTAAEILEALSRELGRDIPLAWWFEAASLAELAARLARPDVAPGAGASAAQGQALADLALEPRLGTVPAARPIRTVLLTGATGFLGAHLVESLRAKGLEVVCLVRAADDAAAQVRLSRALAERRVPDPGGVRAIAGDLAAPGLGGLGGLAGIAGIDAIVHAGAAVSWLASYPALRGPNVLGTLALLELAAARGIPLHHVSTISTAPPDGDEDSRLGLPAALAATPYALSKWIAEEHARRAAAAGVPVAIYRPAMIAAHTERGIGNRDDFLTRYLAGCLELGRYIDDDTAVIDMTPADFVAAAIAALVVAHPRGGGVHHLANADQSPTYAALGRAMAAAGAPVRPAPYAEFRAALLADRACRLHALAAFFPESFSLGMGPWPCRRTTAALAALGVPRPRIDPAIIARYVAGLRA